MWDIACGVLDDELDDVVEVDRVDDDEELDELRAVVDVLADEVADVELATVDELEEVEVAAVDDCDEVDRLVCCVVVVVAEPWGDERSA